MQTSTVSIAILPRKNNKPRFSLLSGGKSTPITIRSNTCTTLNHLHSLQGISDQIKWNGTMVCLPLLSSLMLVLPIYFLTICMYLTVHTGEKEIERRPRINTYLLLVWKNVTQDPVASLATSQAINDLCRRGSWVYSMRRQLEGLREKVGLCSRLLPATHSTHGRSRWFLPGAVVGKSVWDFGKEPQPSACPRPSSVDESEKSFQRNITSLWSFRDHTPPSLRPTCPCQHCTLHTGTLCNLGALRDQQPCHTPNGWASDCAGMSAF